LLLVPQACYLMKKEPHLRPAQIGDICLLIEPDPQADITALHQHQQRLCQQFGGTPIHHIHLTCQRFACADDAQLHEFVDVLTQGFATTVPFPLQAVALEPLAVPVLQTTILKWRIAVTPALLRFNTMAADALVSSGLVSHYAPGFTSSLVAALRDLPADLPAAQLHDPQLPYQLFDAAQLILSQIRGPRNFAILATIAGKAT
jgi:hypothetical protein